MEKRGNIFICQRWLCMPRDRIYWKNVLALAIPLLVFYPRSSQLYISSRSRGSLVIPPFFSGWVRTPFEWETLWPTHTYIRSKTWRVLAANKFSPPSRLLLQPAAVCAPWAPWATWAPLARIRTRRSQPPDAAFIARRFSVSVSSRLRCGIIRKMSLLVWILRNSSEGGMGNGTKDRSSWKNTERKCVQNPNNMT